eukprot:15907430-Heterocapsa_arctica.AAC.1
MDQDARGELTQEELEAWNRSQKARAAELGEDLAEQITAAKEEAAAKEASSAKGSAGKGRSPNPERMHRKQRDPHPRTKERETQGMRHRWK